MKVEDVPQDNKYLHDNNLVRDMAYAIDSNGHYQVVASVGWAPKNEALEMTLLEVSLKCEEVLERYRKGECSPLEYHATRNQMSWELLSEYSGISKRTILKHNQPKNFAALDEKTLQTYAECLRITVEELKQVPQE